MSSFLVERQDPRQTGAEGIIRTHRFGRRTILGKLASGEAMSMEKSLARGHALRGCNAVTNKHADYCNVFKPPYMFSI